MNLSSLVKHGIHLSVRAVLHAWASRAIRRRLVLGCVEAKRFLGLKTNDLARRLGFRRCSHGHSIMINSTQLNSQSYLDCGSRFMEWACLEGLKASVSLYRGRA